MTIRRATEADAPGIAALHRASVRELGASDYGDDVIAAWSTPRTLDDYRSSIATKPFFVADEDGEIAGFTELEPDKRLVRSMYVSPSHTRKGLASALMDALVAEARRLGLPALVLQSSLTAVPFYKRCGFVETDRSQFSLGETLTMDAVEMEMTLE